MSEDIEKSDETLQSVLSGEEKTDEQSLGFYNPNVKIEEIIQDEIENNRKVKYILSFSRVLSLLSIMVAIVALLAVLPNHFSQVTSNFYLLTIASLSIIVSVFSGFYRIYYYSQKAAKIKEEERRKRREKNMSGSF